MGFKIFDFAEIKLSKTYLKALPKRHLNFIVAASLAGNDISVLSKILIGFRSQATDCKVLSEIRGINHWTIRRILGAKIHEFIKLIDRYEKNLTRSKVSAEVLYARELRSFVHQCKSEKQYEFVKKIRDSATNHYMIDDCHQNLDRYKDGANFSILLHNQSGNSYYPIGEELAHLSYFDKDPSLGVNLLEIEEWFQDTAGALIRMQHQIFNRIFEAYPIDLARKTTIFVDDNDTVHVSDKMPILYFDPSRSRL